jgi:hypothetical protein
VVTNAKGAWIVNGLPPGRIRVRVFKPSLPAGLLNSLDPDGGNDSETIAVLDAGQTDLTQDFGYTTPATFGDHVWMDRNGNGTDDPGEPGVAGVTVTLLLDADHDGTYETRVGTTTSNANGDYSFPGLRFGDYCVVVESATAPGGSALTTPDRVEVELSPGEVSLLGDFGLAPTLLPFTGTDPGWLIKIGALAVGVGLLFAASARKRRRAIHTRRA